MGLIEQKKDEIRERLKYLRVQVLELTQQEFADKVGVGRSYISDVERDGKGFGDGYLDKIQSCFHVCSNWIWNGSGDIFNSEYSDLKPIKAEKQTEKKLFVLPQDQPFFMVYAEGQAAPTFKHDSYLQAHEEASRLAKKLACTTYVLTATTKFHHTITTESFAEVDRDELPF